ncbi:MAG: hypothetical protein QOI31_2274 [Solirubrobacterales bacterium]|jgi:DNA-binding SARP family transcriptional activator|nr:hypothetical protein [Solirubrobacterales bacterium]
MLEIRLLGTPEIRREGSEPVAPRGHKTWALLAYLLLSEVKNPSREHLAGLLFRVAADPLRSLRWNLSELRRVVGQEFLPPGRAQVNVPHDCLIDVEILTRGTPEEALSLPGLGQDLLAGMDFSASPGFDGWLMQERRRLIGASASALHEAALDRLAFDRPEEAAHLAKRLLELDPFDENFQELAIRAYAQSGEEELARGQLESCRELFRGELGREPSDSLERAAGEPPVSGGSDSPPPSSAQAATALLEAGEAAAAAGAVDGALQTLRRAVSGAQGAGATELEARALFALGSTLVHAVRGRDEEASSILRRASALAAEAGLAELQAAAVRELSYVDALAGRHARCEQGLNEAMALASSDEELAATESVWALSSGDRGDHAAAIRHAEQSVTLAQKAGDKKRAAYAHTMAGRSQFLTGEIAAARASFESSLDLVRETDWIAFAAFPETWLAEVELSEGDLEGARRRMEYAFALGCEMRDPCWEGLAGRGLGIVEEKDGNSAAALRLLEDARHRAGRVTDSYIWVEAYALEAMAGVAVRSGSSRAPALVEDLRSLAGRTGMREMAARAFLLRHQLGDPTALDAARLMAAEVANPALEAEIAASAA